MPSALNSQTLGGTWKPTTTQAWHPGGMGSEKAEQDKQLMAFMDEVRRVGAIPLEQRTPEELKIVGPNLAPSKRFQIGRGVALGIIGGAGLGAAGAFGSGAGVSGGSAVGGGMGGAGGLTGAGFAGSSAGLGGGVAAGAGAAAGGGFLGGLGLTGAQALGLGVTGLGTIYGANRASKAASEEADIARQALAQANQPRSTQYGSSVNPAAGTSFIDPSIRAMRERSLQNIPGYQSIISGQMNNVLGGDENAFLNPVLQNMALQRGQLSRGLTDRGLGGSSFMSQALGNFESAAAPGIAQAKLQGQLSKLDAAGQGVSQLQNLDNLYANVAGQNLQQELSALGLSQADIGAILGAGQQIGQAGQRVSDVYGRGLDVFGRILSPTPVGSYA